MKKKKGDLNSLDTWSKGYEWGMWVQVILGGMPKSCHDVEDHQTKLHIARKNLEKKWTRVQGSSRSICES